QTPQVGLRTALARPLQARSTQPQDYIGTPRLSLGRACGVNTPRRRTLWFHRPETAFAMICFCAARSDEEWSAAAARLLTLLNSLRPTADKGAGGRDVLSRHQPLFGLVVPFVVLLKPIHCLGITQRAPRSHSPDAIAIARVVAQLAQLRLYPQCVGGVRRISLRLVGPRDCRLPHRLERYRDCCLPHRFGRSSAGRIVCWRWIERPDRTRRRAVDVGRLRLCNRLGRVPDEKIRR